MSAAHPAIPVATAGGDSVSWLVDSQTRRRLHALEPVIADIVRPPELDEAGLAEQAGEMALSGGKRLRPVMTFLAAAFGAAEDHRLVPAAAAVELLHAASLHHDDVVDRSPLRRGRPTLWATDGAAAATTAGDYLVVRAAETMLAVAPGALPELARTAARLAAGQLRELDWSYRDEIGQSDYYRIVADKTTPVFELSVSVGARLGGVTGERREALLTFARHFGTGFQLVDDALDYAGDSGLLGKPVAADLNEGTYSLPVILALEAGGDPAARLREALREAPEDERAAETAFRLVRRSGAAERTRRMAWEHGIAAFDALEALPDVPARESLAALAVQATLRDG